ncbi:hypothetical protein L596_023010 [Steinernema carpocapsae]|uniref:Uncharacterized protein n=1 Tax=Steinernema carpocapsae TaxID=34508 RepID=A0A4U5MCB3_STECR|nr:hypothetical protein L596_023010 [Steinernema carpocapsae]
MNLADARDNARRLKLQFVYAAASVRTIVLVDGKKCVLLSRNSMRPPLQRSGNVIFGLIIVEQDWNTVDLNKRLYLI